MRYGFQVPVDLLKCSFVHCSSPHSSVDTLTSRWTKTKTKTRISIDVLINITEWLDSENENNSSSLSLENHLLKSFLETQIFDFGIE